MTYEEEIKGWMKACQVVDQRRAAFIKGYRKALDNGGLAPNENWWRECADDESVKAFPYPPGAGRTQSGESMERSLPLARRQD